MRGRVLRAISALFLIVSAGAASDARAWWNDEWAFRKELTFNLAPTGADIAQNVDDVPVLVRLSLANFTYFTDAKPDGTDFRFIAADDKTPLKFHIEKFDPQAQIALAWVRLPKLTGNTDKTDKIYLYYGNPKATSGADSAGTYDGSQSLVYHFGAAAGSPQDAAGYKNEPSKLTAEVNTASLIGSGLKFVGEQIVAVNAAPSLQLSAAQGMTVSAWVKLAGPQQQAQVVTLEEGARSLVLGIEGTKALARWRDGGRDTTAVSSTELAPELWHHLALRLGSGQLTLFIDGSIAAQVAASVTDLKGSLFVGASSSGANRYTGELDELQVSNSARTDGWIRAAARSQGMDAPLLVYGADAQKEGGKGPNYFATTMRNVTTDGWVIIGILAALFVLSMTIMAMKGIYLSRVAGGNGKFLAEFHRLRADTEALERAASGGESGDDGFEPTDEVEDDRFGISTLWRLYHHGMREALGRLDDQRKAGVQKPTLSPQAIEAIRATLDATQARMGQSLTNKMVWLTISISGGPFLGLLGTVVGVMIVFAGIAASGDVNINAIAPGTAAALVATVAGLAVAIPCLFGYNYLSTRIKDIGIDMRVFVDEFVARLAETYT
jgi:biopolymer transport protein ExbB